MTKQHFVRITLIVVAYLFARPALAASPETIFKQAERYTVEIKVTINKPFVWDVRSSHSATGFVVDSKRGWILTNAHVSGKSPSTIAVSFKDQEPFNVKPVYIDPLLDLAVLQIPKKHRPKNSTQAKLECNTIAQSGHPVGAYGHPYSLKYTATRGIVSGTNIKNEKESLQTDAPINSGNSGGPLISLETGRVVGINKAKIKKRGVEGLNFAIASPYACRILDLLRSGKNPSPAVMPAVFLEENRSTPPVVAAVLDNTPNNPLKEGDIVIGVNGSKNTITSLNQLQHEMRGHGPALTWQIKRNGKQITVPLTIKRLSKIEDQVGVYVSGIMISQNTFLNEMPGNQPLQFMIHSIDRGAAASRYRFEAFQNIVSIDGKRFKTLRSLHDYLKTIKKSKNIKIKVKYTTYKFTRLYDYYEAKLPMEDLEWINFKWSKANRANKLERANKPKLANKTSQASQAKIPEQSRQSL